MAIQDDEKRWQLRALCRGTTSLFYEAIWLDVDSDPDPLALEHAAAICAACPVRRPCFAQVLGDEENAAVANRHGLAAGMTPQQRWSAEKREASHCCECGEILDPINVALGNLDCLACGNKRRVPPIPRDGDTWNRRHTILARRVVEWLVNEINVGASIPLPTPLARKFSVRTADMVRVYEALVADGTLERVGKVYHRRSNPASFRTWEPRHLAAA